MSDALIDLLRSEPQFTLEPLDSEPLHSLLGRASLERCASPPRAPPSDAENRSPQKPSSTDNSQAPKEAQPPASSRPKPPPRACKSTYKLLRWACYEVTGKQAFFSSPLPSDPQLKACAKKYTVPRLLELFESLSFADERHGKLEDTPFLAMFITPDGYVPPASGPTPLTLVVSEGFCGIWWHTTSDALREMDDARRPESVLFNPEMLSAIGMEMPFRAETVTEVRARGAPDSIAAEEVSMTAQVTSGTVVQVLSAVPNPCLFVNFNKYAFCRQVLSIWGNDGAIMITCCNKCNEEVAAEHMHHIIKSAAAPVLDGTFESAYTTAADDDAAAPPPPSYAIDEMAHYLAFHNCSDASPSGASVPATAHAWGAVTGRRHLQCGCDDQRKLILETNRAPPTGCRDGAFDALRELGVRRVAMAAMPHLGWVCKSVRIRVVELPDGDGDCGVVWLNDEEEAEEEEEAKEEDEGGDEYCVDCAHR